MKKTKAEKGITLIALIITIIVLIILAVVTIQAVQEHGIIGYAKKAQKTSIEAEEKDQIGLALSEWKIAKVQPNPPTFDAFLKEKFGDDNVTAGGEEGEWLVTFPKSGNQYKVKEDGTIENTKGITLSKSSLTLTLKTGTTVTDTITATLHGIEGSTDEIAWTIPEETKATINPEKGATITVTAVAAGETTITATCGEYNATCKVTVEEEHKLAKGDFVKYNVEYTDVYFSGYQYTAENGWRYLGPDPYKQGNNLIMSTGIPARLYYISDGVNRDWIVSTSGSDGDDPTKKTLGGFKNLLRGDSDYRFYTGTLPYYALGAAAGLYHNFGNVIFKTSEVINCGYFLKITNKGTTYDKTYTTQLRGNDLFISKEAEKAKATVRLLTLPEVNRAIGREDIDSTTNIEADEDNAAAVGLFRLDQLKNINSMFNYNYDSKAYWYVASPWPYTYNYQGLARVSWDGLWNSDSNTPRRCPTSYLVTIIL